MINVIIYLCMALMPMGGPTTEEIIFGPTVIPTTLVEPQAMYFNQTINLVYANPEVATVNVYTLARHIIKAFNLRHNYKTYNNQSNYSHFKILEI